MRYLIALLAILVFAAPVIAAPPKPISNDVRIVENLSYIREVNALSQTTLPLKLDQVVCKATSRAHIYVCAFLGHNVKTQRSNCVATYVHYNSALGQQVNFWRQAWPCSARPPVPPPPYPGDSGGPTA